MNTYCDTCGQHHTDGSARAAEAILNGNGKVRTAYGVKTACGLAAMIDEAAAPELAEALKRMTRTGLDTFGGDKFRFEHWVKQEARAALKKAGVTL